MLKLLLLIKRLHLVLLFLIFEGVALYFFSQSTPHTRAVSSGITSEVTAYFNEKFSGVADYFALEELNEELMAQNAMLLKQISGFVAMDSLGGVSDSLPAFFAPMDVDTIIPARVIRNTYGRRDNFITLDKGTRDGMSPDMALFNAQGIIGYTLYCSSNYTVALSVLSASDFKVGGRLLGTEFAGLVSWDGGSYREMDIIEVPKYADLKEGDTVVTQFSNIFPDNLPIGRVVEFEPSQDIFYTARLELFADMSTLRNIYAVRLLGQNERAELEAKLDE